MADEFLVYKAKVESVDDENCGMRIKVRLGIDGTTPTEQLPYCFPFLPKLLHVMPKVDECVLIILEKEDGGKSNRYFIGPVLSQPYNYEQELYDTTAMNLLQTEQKREPLPHPKTRPENNGTLPDIEDIALLGRENADIVLKPNEIRLRCGYKENPTGPVEERLYYNSKNPAYIQMRYQDMTDNRNDRFSSIINIVADRINFIPNEDKPSHNESPEECSDNNFNKGQDLITDQDLMDILDTIHPLVYGDNLINFLKRFIDVFQRHTHPFAMKPPCFKDSDEKVLETNLDSMLSKRVKTY